MTEVKRHIRHIGLWMLSVMTLVITGCRDFEADAILSREPVNVQFAFSLSSLRNGSHTRQSDGVVSNTAVEILKIVPMRGGAIDDSEVSNLVEVVDKTGLAKFYRYGYCNMQPGVDGCLVYAKATDEGGLEATLPEEVTSTDDISFAPTTIYNYTTAPADGEAWDIAEALTAVANTGGWSTTTNTTLKNLYNNFINHGYDLPGSAASVMAWIKALKEEARKMSGLSGTDEDLRGTLAAIDIPTTLPNYPQSVGLPDGAAALRWTTWTDGQGKHTGFMPQLQTTTIDNINTVSRFAYPPAKYYFVNSSIKSSDTPVDLASLYNINNTWEGVLQNFPFEGVTAASRAIALKDPVQYAVAQLNMTVKASASSLKDDNSADVTLGTEVFPLRGIIVGGQRAADYKFEPVSNSDANVKFVYDHQGMDGRYLTTTATAATSTLVLQSYDGEDVLIILEFENNSDDVTFKCVDGMVYPHTRFYLIGKVEALKGADVIDSDEKTHQVFTKDYITTVNMTVTSLAKAYNVLPNLLGGSLELGVELTTKWIQAETTNVLLNESD